MVGIDELVATFKRQTMTTKSTLIILNIAGLIGTLIWLMVTPSWEPLVTTLGLAGALIAQLKYENDGKGDINMKQKGGQNSTNYQAGGDIKITK